MLFTKKLPFDLVLYNTIQLIIREDSRSHEWGFCGAEIHGSNCPRRKCFKWWAWHLGLLSTYAWDEHESHGFVLEKQEVWSRADRAAYQPSLLLLLTCALKVINTVCIICTVQNPSIQICSINLWLLPKNMVMRKSLGLGIASDTYVKLFTNSWIRIYKSLVGHNSFFWLQHTSSDIVWYCCWYILLPCYAHFNYFCHHLLQDTVTWGWRFVEWVVISTLKFRMCSKD